MKSTKKEYINLIRWSCMIDSFANSYFMRIIVLYLLSQNVTPWIAVSIPIVLEFATMISRGFKFLEKLSLKLDYKKYHIFHLVAFFVLGLIISQCRSVYTIYLFTVVSGFLTGLKHSMITRVNTQNKEFEPYCFIEEERSQVVGYTLGLIISQFVYDVSAKAYLIGYIVLMILGTICSMFLKNVPKEDAMKPIDEHKPLDKKTTKNTITITVLFGMIAGMWCMALGAFNEIAPLISNKIGYLEAVYTGLEVILLFIITGSLIEKIKKKNKMLLTETCIAILDIICLLIASITLSWKGLLVAYIIMGFDSTLGDPLWGSIMSAYSENNRTQWILVNRVYFFVRAIFTLLTWLICRQCVIMGLVSFRYLAIVLLLLTVIVFIIANHINKKVFGRSI